MSVPPDITELPVDDSQPIFNLEEIAEAIQNMGNDVELAKLIINSLCKHMNDAQDAHYDAWENAMGEDL